MAQYKVPQDVEAEDKLLGPFTFRQFIYLVVAVACFASAWGMFQIFPFLALLPLPFGAFFAVLALPLKKDQPMETYLSAIVSYHLKPHVRVWTPGQQETIIQITAPKKVEAPRYRDITEEEASHRLSFLADIVDTEGYSIHNKNTPMKEEYAAEAENVPDMLELPSENLDNLIARDQASRRAGIVAEMRTEIEAQERARAADQQAYQIPNAYFNNFNQGNPSF